MSRIHNEIFDDLKTYMEHGFKSKATIKEFLSFITYSWTEYQDKGVDDYVKAKTIGCKFWSKKALQLLFTNSSIDFDNCVVSKDQKRNKIDNSKLIHEHVIPKQILKDTISDLKNKKDNGCDIESDLNKLKVIMDDHFIGCIITKTEADNLDSVYRDFPTDRKDIFEIDDNKEWWRRYKEYNEHTQEKIEIYKCKWQQSDNKRTCWKLLEIEKVEF